MGGRPRQPSEIKCDFKKNNGTAFSGPAQRLGIARNFILIICESGTKRLATALIVAYLQHSHFIPIVGVGKERRALFVPW